MSKTQEKVIRKSKRYAISVKQEVPLKLFAKSKKKIGRNYSFNEEENSMLIDHKNGFHIGFPRGGCDICLAGCLGQLISDDDEPTDAEKIGLKCNACSKMFLTQTKLNRHKLIHTGRKPNECDICKKTFLHKHHLRQHIISHSGKKPYKCKICGAKFTLKSNLKNHFTIHYDKQRFRCNVCQKGFTKKQNYEVHIRIHTGDQPFKCDVCNKSFSQIHHLKRHCVVHTGLKSFVCSWTGCKRAFTTKDNLRTHMRKRHS